MFWTRGNDLDLAWKWPSNSHHSLFTASSRIPNSCWGMHCNDIYIFYYHKCFLGSIFFGTKYYLEYKKHVNYACLIDSMKERVISFYVWIWQIVMELPVEHGLLLDNLLDLAHAPFTHTSTFAKGWSVPRFVPVIITIKCNQFSQGDKNFSNLSRMVPFIMFKITCFYSKQPEKVKKQYEI